MDKEYRYPPFYYRIYSVWYRHVAVYTKNLISNGFPPFLEPIIFLGAFGLGFSQYIISMNGVPYLQYLASGIILTSAMYTAAFECSYGTFIRLEFDKVYEGMLAAPLKVRDIIIGEILWAGTKGFFFSFAVLIVFYLFNIIPINLSLLSPFIGFMTGVLFASLSLLITAFVSNINYFNFYFTGLLTPMFFFSGVMFPIENLPPSIQPICEFFPLTHTVKLVRAVCFSQYDLQLLFSIGYIFIFTFLLSYLAIKKLKTRLID